LRGGIFEEKREGRGAVLLQMGDLLQAFKILGYVRQNKTFSQSTAKALRTIKYSAMSLVAFIVGAEGFFFIAQRGEEDIAGGVAIGLFLIFISVVVATAAAVSERILQDALDIAEQVAAADAVYPAGGQRG